MVKWISVKERLPEISQQVLIFVSDEREIHVAQFCDWEKEICNDWHITAGAYTYEPLVFEQNRVTHWMPLPEIPQMCDWSSDALSIDNGRKGILSEE